jgi:hypothetical protein
MRTVKATVYRVIGGEKIVLASLSPISREGAAAYHWFADRPKAGVDPRMRRWFFEAVIAAVVLASCGGGVVSGAGGGGGTGGGGAGGGVGGDGRGGGGGNGGGGGSTTCEYLPSQSVKPPATFSLSVTLPDGGVQSCASLRPPDGGTGPLRGEVSGWVTEVGAAAFSLDTCAAGTGCSPEVYRFAVDAPDLTVPLPLARQVTVTWLFSAVVGRACLQLLVVNDGLPSQVASGTWPALWLAGADSTIQSSIPVPFSVVQQPLSCNPNPSPTHPCGGTSPPDDYALVFTPSSGEPPLSLATGKTGTLTLTPAPGLQQHLTVRNLRSYQTENCDDYWNWGWWAVGRASASGQLE